MNTLILDGGEGKSFHNVCMNAMLLQSCSILWSSTFFMVQFSQPYVGDHSLDYLELRQQSNISAFQHTL